MSNESTIHNTSLLNGLWVNDRKYNLRILGAMMAVEVLMAYSPFGFVVLPTISITTLSIGVLAAALWGGPFAGAMVGLVFGLTSMWKASVTATNPNDLIFSPVRSGNPFGSIILALGPRILFGIISGLVYYVIMRFLPRKTKVRLPVLLAVSVILDRVYSTLTYFFMDKMFHVEGASASKAWTHLLSSNRIKTFLVVIFIVACAYFLYDKFLSKKYYEQFTMTSEISTKITLKYTLLIIATVLVIILTASHLWERIQIILFDIDQFPPEQANANLIAQVINQFVVAAISSLYVVVIILKHARNVEEIERSKAIVQLDIEKERAEQMELHSLKDPLTGVFNRKGLIKIVADDNLGSCPTGYLLVDIDHFKEINDTFGHDAGDNVLTETAKLLAELFGENRVFRLGGDEFSVLISDEHLCTGDGMTRNWDMITDNFELISSRLSSLLSKEIPVTLSVGACFSETGYSEELYPLADSALYETKSNGRAGCTLVDRDRNILAKWKNRKAKPDKLFDELNNIGVCRTVSQLDGSRPPQLFCSEAIRNFLCVPSDSSPESCYEYWFKGISPDDIDGFYSAREKLMEDGVVFYNYEWNHPLKGTVRVESCSTGKIENGILSVASHMQLFVNSD